MMQTKLNYFLIKFTFTFMVLALNFNQCHFFDQSDCNFNLNKVSDNLSISSEIIPKIPCLVTINRVESAKFLVLFIETFEFEIRDYVQILNIPSQNLVSNVTRPGLFFLDSKSSVLIKLQPSEQNYSRTFAFRYSYNSQLSLLLSQPKRLKTLSYVGSDYTFNATSLNLTLNLWAKKVSPTADDQKIVAVVNSLQNAKVLFDNSSYSNSDFISANEKLEVKVFFTGTISKNFDFYFDLVNGKCSTSKELNQNFSSFSIDSSQAQKFENALKCVWLINLKSDDKAYLNIHFENPLFNNNLEYYIIRNGSRSNSTIITTLYNSNVDEIKNSVTYSILNSKSLHVTFNGYYPTKPTAQGYLNITRNIHSVYYRGTASINLNETQQEKGPIFILFQSDFEQASLDLYTRLLKKANLSVYSTLSGKKEDLLFFSKANDSLPKQIWSSTKFLLLKFSNLETFKGSLNSNNMSKNSIATGAQSTFLLQSSNLTCGQTVNWLIPSKINENGDVISLTISSLMLEDNSQLKLFNVSDDKKIFELTGLSNTQMQTLPTLLLQKSTGHLVSYTRSNSSSCDTKLHTLLQSTVGVIQYDESQSTYEIDHTKNVTIFSANYPNNYAILESTLNQQYISIKSNTSLVYWTFTDLDLAYNLGHFLSIEASSFDQIKISKELPSDFITPPLVALNFERSFSFLQANQSVKLSGRGFQANLEALSCGQMIVDKPQNLILDASKLLNVDKCVYIIKSNDEKKVITLEMNSIPPNLIIYDSSSLRDTRVLNLSYAVNKTVSSSTNFLILSYLIDHKAQPHNISIKYSDCKERCSNNRCLNQLWKCNGLDDCGDRTDELYCNGTSPLPPPPPPIVKNLGVSNWVVVFVIIPFSMIVGAILAIYGPQVVCKRDDKYTEFRDYSDVS